MASGQSGAIKSLSGIRGEHLFCNSVATTDSNYSKRVLALSTSCRGADGNCTLDQIFRCIKYPINDLSHFIPQ
jgi:hypothetical protein